MADEAADVSALVEWIESVPPLFCGHYHPELWAVAGGHRGSRWAAPSLQALEAE